VPAEKVTGRVVVIGGGETGCDTAVYFAMDKRFDVTLIGRNRNLTKDAGPIAGSALMKHLQEYAKGIYSGTACTAINDKSVTCERYGDIFTVPADTIIIASGMESLAEEGEQFRKISAEFRRIGDSEKVGNVRTAVRQGYDAAVQI